MTACIKDKENKWIKIPCVKVTMAGDNSHLLVVTPEKVIEVTFENFSHVDYK